MIKFPIDKGVPLPSKKITGPKALYPWDDLEVGDSFFVPGEDPKARQGVVSAAGAGWVKRNDPDRRFTTRQV